MPKGYHLGELEMLVLLSIQKLEIEAAYGMRIQRLITEDGERNVSIGSVYAALDRLQEKLFVTSVLWPPTPERGGRSKRTYALTLDGESALQRALRAIVNLEALEVQG